MKTISNDKPRATGAPKGEVGAHTPRDMAESFYGICKTYYATQAIEMIDEAISDKLANSHAALSRHWSELAYHANVLANARTKRERDAATLKVFCAIGNAKDEMPELLTLSDARAALVADRLALVEQRDDEARKAQVLRIADKAKIAALVEALEDAEEAAGELLSIVEGGDEGATEQAVYRLALLQRELRAALASAKQEAAQ